MPDAPTPAAKPDCLTMDDAIIAVRECLKNLIGGAADHLKLSTGISDAFPGDPDLALLRSLLNCLKHRTKFDLKADDFADGSFQDIADKLACVEG